MDSIYYKVNDTVLCNGLPVTIDNISGDFYYVSSGESVKKDKLSDIPLTKDILDRSNVVFSQIGQELMAVFGNRKLYINIQNGECRITDSLDSSKDSTLTDIFSFHQLQNIIYEQIHSKLILNLNQ